jgi:hypothetical protein
MSGLRGLLSRLDERAGEGLVLKALVATGMAAVCYYAQDRGTDPVTRWIVAAVGMAGVYYCYRGSALSAHAWCQRRPARLVSSLLLLAGAATLEVSNHLAVGSTNADNVAANQVQLAAAWQSAEAELNAARGARASIYQRRDDLQRAIANNDSATLSINGVTITTAEAAQAIIDETRAHRWWARTDQCSKPAGAETTAYCKRYREAEAAKSMAGERMRKAADLRAELAAAVKAVPEAEDAVRQAESRVLSGRPTTSRERADSRNLQLIASRFGIELDPQLYNSLLIVLGLCLFITVRKWQLTCEEYEGQPLPPWGIANALRSVVGKAAPTPARVHRTWQDNTTPILVRPPRVGVRTMTYAEAEREGMLR